MLRIEIPLTPECWDEEKQEFVDSKTQTLQLEHSLVSLSKWESKWCKPFFSTNAKTYEEVLDYINAPMTATTFNETSTKGRGRDIITSELIYYWMIAFNIPVEFQKWHINRLLTLIRVCEIKNSPGKKMSSKEITSQYAALNAARKKKLNTKG